MVDQYPLHCYDLTFCLTYFTYSYARAHTHIHIRILEYTPCSMCSTICPLSLLVPMETPTCNCKVVVTLCDFVHMCVHKLLNQSDLSIFRLLFLKNSDETCTSLQKLFTLIHLHTHCKYRVIFVNLSTYLGWEKGEKISAE